MTLQNFNSLDREEASRHLAACCGSEQWVSRLMEKFPFSNEAALLAMAEETWYRECTDVDWLNAFAQHPRIGDLKSLTEKFAGKEQASVGTATAEVIAALADANAEYERKFGFIFIVCATGKPAGEMLRILQDRLANDREEELDIAMGEQHKITIIRLKKLLDEGDWSSLKISQLTTHVLDTSLGKPGEGITIRLKRNRNGLWSTMSQGITNADGRIADLLPPCKTLSPGNYKMHFDTGKYYSTQGITGFYPSVEIEFAVFDSSHYHVPLLLNPYGYSTYRGS